jgi:hypothetical protein
MVKKSDVGTKADTTLANAKIDETFAALKRDHVLIPVSPEVRDYLLRYPDMIDCLVPVAELAREELGSQPQLSLELYRDPEIDDQYLTLYVRQEPLDDDLMDKIDKILEDRRGILDNTSGWLLVTTDGRPPL